VPSALRHRDYRVFWTGQALSSFGTQFTTVATAWQIYELTNSPLQIGLLGLARAIPQMGLLLLGGLLADAVDRRRLLMAVQILQFGVSTTLAGLTATGQISPTVLYGSVSLLAICTALGNPARQAIVPNLVPRSDLSNALAVNNSARQISSIAGPSLAGILLGVAGPAWCYATDALSWIVMLAALTLIQTRQEDARGRVAWSALAEGLSFVRANRILMAMIGLDFGAPRALLPIFARDLFQVGPQGLGLLYTATSLGSFAAAAGLSVLGQPRAIGRWIVGGLACFGACAMGFAFTPQLSLGYPLALILLAGMGASDTMNAILRNTLNQLLTPDALRGRVTSVSSMFTSSGPQLGQVESGVTADWWGAEAAAGFGGAATVVIVAAVALISGLWSFQRQAVEAETG
jgi:MFS family permease